MRVLVNAGNLTASGPQMVLRNLLPALVSAEPGWSFVALLPKRCRDWDLSPYSNLQVRFSFEWVPRSAYRFFEMFVLVPALCRRFNVDACLTLGNIGPIRLQPPHVVLLHHSYVLEGTESTRFLPLYHRLVNAYTKIHFEAMTKRCCRVIVQTPVMAESVCRTFGLGPDRVTVVPSTLSDSNRAAFADRSQSDPRIAGVRQPIKLLFLAAHYWHKNHRMVEPVMRELQRRGLVDRVHMFLTVDGRSQHTRELMTALAPFRDSVTNLGPLDQEAVPRVFSSCDALFLPTLMESFGLIYLEAMAAGIPILTSDRGFARWMCADLARYFNPQRPGSIADVIEQFINAGRDPSYPERAAERLKSFPGSWQEIGRSYAEVLRDCVA